MKKKKIIIISLIILIIIVLVISELIQETQKEIALAPSVIQNYDNTRSQINNIVYTGEDKSNNLPNKMSLFNITVNQNKNDQIQKFTNLYQLQPLDDIAGIWKGPNYTLAYSKHINSFNLTTNSSPLSNQSKTLDTNKAIQKSNQLAQKYFENSNIKVVKNDISYSQNSLHMSPTKNDSEAQLVIIPLTYYLENIPVFFNNLSYYPYEFIIDREYQLKKATFVPYTVNFSGFKKETTLTLSQAINNINNNIAAIVHSSDDNNLTINLKDITSGEFEDFSLEYRADMAQNIAYPFYRFYGYIENQEGETAYTEIITPAIKTSTEYLNQ